MNFGIFTILLLASNAIGQYNPTVGSCKLNKYAALTKLLTEINRYEEMCALRQSEDTKKEHANEVYSDDNDSDSINLIKELQRKNCPSDDRNDSEYFEAERGMEVEDYCENENKRAESEEEPLEFMESDDEDDSKNRQQENIRQGIVQCINKYRGLHGAEPLKTSSEITKKAQDWANKLVSQNILSHRPNSKYGENIWSYSSWPAKTPKAEVPCKIWYSEEKKFDFGKESIQGSGHFTQMVWKASKEIGVGVANKGGKWIVVADFYPPGNVLGHVLANVKSVVKPN